MTKLIQALNQGVLAPGTWRCTCSCHLHAQYLPHRKPCCDAHAQNISSGQFSDQTEHSPKTDHAPDTTLLLQEVRERAEARRAAQAAYVDVITRAYDAGIPWRPLGIAAGVTGDCLRMQIKRAR